MFTDYLFSPLRKIILVFICSMVPTPFLLWYVFSRIMDIYQNSGDYWTAAITIGISILVGGYINGVLNYRITYKIQPDVRMSGIPIPVVFEEFENGTWYDYPVFYGLLVGICYFSLMSLAITLFLVKAVGFSKVILVLIIAKVLLDIIPKIKLEIWVRKFFK
jgi:hypothetical protein